MLEAIDGERTIAQVADAVSIEYGRRLSGEDAQTLVESQLRRLGLVVGADGSQPQVQRSNPLLALRLRWVVSDPGATRRLTAPFAVLFAPVVVVPVVLAFVAISAWVLFTKGLASATHQAFDQPLLLVVVFAFTVLSAGFHEFGHASACRYGGATPGAMGTGLSLVWPAFYTDVTDSYRLDRAGRLRVDLGGLYFNAIVSVAMFAVWAVTGWDAILLILAAQLLQMVRQLAPMVRFDGYHVLADLTGVPDLQARMGAILAALWPGRSADPRVTALKRGPRIIVTAWVLAIVPLLAFTLVMMVLALPRVLGTAWASVGRQSHALAVDWAGGDALGVTVRVLAVVAVALPVLGSLLLLARLVRTTSAATWRRTAGHPGRRAVAGLTAAAVLAGLAYAWWPDANRYRPVQPFEKGTLTQAVASAGYAITGTPDLQDGQLVDAQRSVWASTSTPPTHDHPELALVLIPRAADQSSSTSAPPPPAWVFPFNRPGTPGPGDNQALAVNTTNGSTVYDVAFALVWADGTSVTNANEAYAFASCTRCTTVSVAFQVVLITGSANLAIPQNVAGAVNYSCVQCLTYALAQQLVLTVPSQLPAQARQRLDALWAQISAYAASIQGLPIDQVRARLLDYQNQIQTLITAQADLTTSPTAPGPTPTSSSPTATGTAAGTATGTASPAGTGAPAGQGATAGATPAPPATTPVPATTPDASSVPTTDGAATTPAATATGPASTPSESATP